MAQHHRHRGRDAPSRWDYDDVTLLDWLAVAAAVVVSVAIIWAAM